MTTTTASATMRHMNTARSILALAVAVAAALALFYGLHDSNTKPPVDPAAATVRPGMDVGVALARAGHLDGSHVSMDGGVVCDQVSNPGFRPWAVCVKGDRVAYVLTDVS